MTILGLKECPCPHLDRNSPHGKRIREAYEDKIINIIRKAIVHRDAEIYGEINIAVIGSGELFQEYKWLTKLFQGRCHGRTHLDLVDLSYKVDRSCVNALKTYFNTQIQSHKLTITAWDSCEALLAAKKTHHLIIGMDTEHATADAAKYQWQTLIQGDLEKTLMVRWNYDDQNGHFFQIYSRKGSEGLRCKSYPYTLKSIDPQVVDDVVSYIGSVA